VTHCEKVLTLLSDGKPHTHHELYRLGVIAHSRVADLRRKGHNIACWTAREHGENVSVYQLVGSLEGAAACGEYAVPSSESSESVDDLVITGSARLVGDSSLPREGEDVHPSPLPVRSPESLFTYPRTPDWA